jgi:hypothetical protein
MPDLIAVLSTSTRLPDDATSLAVRVSRSLDRPLVFLDAAFSSNRLPALRHRIDHLAIKRAARNAELSAFEQKLRSDGVSFTVLEVDAFPPNDGLELPGIAFVSDPRGREWSRRHTAERLESIAHTVVLVRRSPAPRTAVIVRPVGAPVSDPPAFLAALGIETTTIRCAAPHMPPDPLRKAFSPREIERMIGSIRPSFVIVEGKGTAARHVLGRMLDQRSVNVGWIPTPVPRVAPSSSGVTVDLTAAG